MPARELTVAEVAERLGRDASRVRQLLRTGALDGERRGRDWLVDPASVDRLQAAERGRGRPLSPAHAWALLWLASGDARLRTMANGWLQPWAAWRLRRILAHGDWRARLPLLRRRAQVHHLRAHPSDLPRLQADHDFVATGVSAADIHDFDIVAPGTLEGYVPADRLGELREEYLLEPGDRPNVILHEVDEPWPFPLGMRVAPPIAVAADLAEASDERTRRAGLAYLRALDAACEAPVT